MTIERGAGLWRSFGERNYQLTSILDQNVETVNISQTVYDIRILITRKSQR